jgi:adenylate kinase family enzyme
MIYVLYGQPASGKTTLGGLLAGYLGTPFIIDGDEFRGMFANKNYGREGREENIRNANAVATYLNKYLTMRDVVMCLVNPYKFLRDELRENNVNQVTEILLTSNRELRKEHHAKDFEDGVPNYEMNTDRDAEDSWGELKNALELEMKEFKKNTLDHLSEGAYEGGRS